MNEFWWSSVVFTAIFCAMLGIGLLIYKEHGWKSARKFYALSAIIPFITIAPIIMNNQYVLSGFYVGIGMYMMLLCLAWLPISVALYNNKDKYEKFINEKIDELGDPSDSDLLKTKDTMGYDKRSPNYKKMNGYLEREELTRRWRNKQRLELDDPIEWYKTQRDRNKRW